MPDILDIWIYTYRVAHNEEWGRTYRQSYYMPKILWKHAKNFVEAPSLCYKVLS